MAYLEDTLEAPRKLKLLVTICERKKLQFYLDILEGYEVNMQTVFYGEGTAPKEIYGFLGVQSDKAIIVSAVLDEKIKEIFINYEDKYFKTKNGKGVAFTIPINSIIGISVYKFLANMEESKYAI